MPGRSSLEGCTVLIVSYSEKVVDESENVEKCVKEGTTNHASEILSNKSEERP
jgi:hypothetical protein